MTLTSIQIAGLACVGIVAIAFFIVWLATMILLSVSYWIEKQIHAQRNKFIPGE